MCNVHTITYLPVYFGTQFGQTANWWFSSRCSSGGSW